MVRISDIGGMELNGQMFSNYLFNANVSVNIRNIAYVNHADEILFRSLMSHLYFYDFPLL